MDRLIRSALRSGVQTEEPAAAVRDALLSRAANADVSRSAIGPSIPAIAGGLQEGDQQTVELDVQVITAIPLASRQLLLLAAPLYAVR